MSYKKSLSYVKTSQNRFLAIEKPNQKQLKKRQKYLIQKYEELGLNIPIYLQKDRMTRSEINRAYQTVQNKLNREVLKTLPKEKQTQLKAEAFVNSFNDRVNKFYATSGLSKTEQKLARGRVGSLGSRGHDIQIRADITLDTTTLQIFMDEVKQFGLAKAKKNFNTELNDMKENVKSGNGIFIPGLVDTKGEYMYKSIVDEIAYFKPSDKEQYKERFDNLSLKEKTIFSALVEQEGFWWASGVSQGKEYDVLKDMDKIFSRTRNAEIEIT